MQNLRRHLELAIRSLWKNVSMVLAGKVPIHESAKLRDVSRGAGRAQVAQRHRKKGAAGADCGARLWPERAVKINIIARIGGGVVLLGRSGKRRPAETNVECANVADAPAAAGALHVRAGKRVLQKMQRLAKPFQRDDSARGPHRPYIQVEKSRPNQPRSEPIQDSKRSDGHANRRQADRPASFEFGLELAFAFPFEFSLEFPLQFTLFRFQFSLK